MKIRSIHSMQLACFLALICPPWLAVAGADDPSPEPRPPGDVHSPDVRDSVTYDLGDRRMTVQEVTEATLPIQPPPAEPIARTPHKLPDEVLAAHRAMLAKRRSLSFGGTAYKTAAGTHRSLITYRPAAGGVPVVFWSSIDWDLLRVGRFYSPDGMEYSLMNMVTPIDIPRFSAFLARHGRAYQAPAIPEFSAGEASYRIVSGQPTALILADLDAVHAFHDREYAVLAATQQRREEARLLAAEAAKLPLPPPPDIIIQGRAMTPEELVRPQDQGSTAPNP